jgi:sigma54-dependent transcription regulator
LEEAVERLVSLAPKREREKERQRGEVSVAKSGVSCYNTITIEYRMAYDCLFAYFIVGEY